MCRGEYCGCERFRTTRSNQCCGLLGGEYTCKDGGRFRLPPNAATGDPATGRWRKRRLPPETP
eukprot:1352823-Prymnesium_polylepis.1